jgi:hypothetical protein
MLPWLMALLAKSMLAKLPELQMSQSMSQWTICTKAPTAHELMSHSSTSTTAPEKNESKTLKATNTETRRARADLRPVLGSSFYAAQNIYTVSQSGHVPHTYVDRLKSPKARSVFFYTGFCQTNSSVGQSTIRSKVLSANNHRT